MNLEIVSYNGVSLNDSSFKAYFPVPSVMTGPDVDIGEVERSYFAPITTYKKRKSKFLFLNVRMLGVIASNIDTLNALFNPYDPDEHKLLVKDLNDSDKQYYVMGTPGSHPAWEGEELVVSLKVADPIWKTETESETPWTITADGDQETVVVGGSFYSEPAFEITPTAAKSGGSGFRIYCPVYNPIDTDEYEDYPFDLVNDSLDTTVLIADNSNKCQINQVGGIDAVVTTIPYDTVTGTIPSAGMGYCGTEQFTWTGKTGTTSGNLTGCTRGVNGTSAATHADNAEIKVSKMNADCSDVRVVTNGTQSNFWIRDPNTSTTQIWSRVTLSPTRDTTLGIAIASSGEFDDITLENTTQNTSRLLLMPSRGQVVIGSEVFSYSSKNTTTRKLIGISRAVHGSSMAAHSVGDSVKWIENEIFIYYGNHGLPSFTVDDDWKPYIELDSTNTNWKYDSVFARTELLTAAWIRRFETWRGLHPIYWYLPTYDYYDRVYSTLSYGYYESMATTAPSSQTLETGRVFSAVGEYYVNQSLYPTYSTGVSGNHPVIFYHPAGFTQCSVYGNKWMASTAGTDWYATAAGSYIFKKSNVASRLLLDWWTDFDDAFNTAQPASFDTITAWSQVAFDLGGTQKYFGMIPLRTTSARDGEVRIEITSASFVIVSTDVPQVIVCPSVEMYHINAELVNATTGEYIVIDHYCDLGRTLIVDTAEKIVLDVDSGMSKRGAMLTSTYRHDWLKLSPGSNVLQWNEANATGLTIAIKRRERKL